jgi:hypothetical protein
MERLVTGLLLGMVLFWAGACLWLSQGALPDWWLPTAFAAGITLAIRLPTPAAAAAPRWARATAWIVIGTAFAALWRGALATASRHWDGAASLDAKVFWLSHTPTLQQPFFATDGVFHHSPDYPLLLPLLIAMSERLAPGFGRIALPLVYMLLCGVVTVALQRRAVQPLLRVAVTVAVAVTPSLLQPNGGAVDSGYSDCLLLLATTIVAAGLLNQHRLWFALGITLLVAAKPEGLPYAAVALAAAFACGERRLLLPGALALGLAGAVWEPVRAVLMHADYHGIWLLVATTLVAGGGLLANHRIAAWFDRRQRLRWLLVISPPIVVMLALPWLAPMFASSTGALALYLRQGENVLAGFGNLPAYAAGVVEFGVTRLRLGMALLLPIAAAVFAGHRHVRLMDRSLMAFVLLGLATTALPFVLSPEPKFDHHLRSSLPRLLLHWVGPLWLLAAAWLETLAKAAGNATSVDQQPE